MDIELTRIFEQRDSDALAARLADLSDTIRKGEEAKADRAALLMVANLTDPQQWSQTWLADKAGISQAAVSKAVGKGDPVTLYDTNADIIYAGYRGEVWCFGPATPDMTGKFALDAAAWAGGDWEPNEGDGQTLSTDDDLTQVATWTKREGVQLLVDKDRLGAGPLVYLGLLAGEPEDDVDDYVV